MFLSADEIVEYFRSGQIAMEPFCEQLLKPSSYVLRIGNMWRRWRQGSVVDVGTRSTERDMDPPFEANEVILEPRQFILGATLERLSIPTNLTVLLFPLSHIARYGLFANLGSALVSPGYGRKSPCALTLELSSLTCRPLRIHAGTPICHAVFVRTTENAETFKPSIYEAMGVPAGPQLFEEYQQLLGPGPNEA